MHVLHGHLVAHGEGLAARDEVAQAAVGQQQADDEAQHVEPWVGRRILLVGQLLGRLVLLLRLDLGPDRRRRLPLPDLRLV